MTEKEIQIKLVLGGSDIWQWANDRLKPGQKMEDMTYFDFINVTYDEIVRHAMKNGLGSFFIEVNNLVDPIKNYDYDARTCIYKKDNRYEVFHTEHGQKDVLGVFFSKSEMVEFLVKKRMLSTWRILTVLYCQKHYPDKMPQEVLDTMNLF